MKNTIKIIMQMVLFLFSAQMSYSQWLMNTPNGTDNIVHFNVANSLTSLGIGNFSATNPGSALHVNTNLTTAQTGGGAFGLGEVLRTDAPNTISGTNYDTYWRLLHNGTDKFNIFNKYNDDIIGLGTVQSARLDFFTNGTANTKMTILSGGNVGIGTISPNYLLHQDGGTGNFTYHQFTNGGTTGTTSTDGFLFGINSSGYGIINNQENGPIQFLTNASSTPKVEISSAGKVGIGTTSQQNLLHQHVTGNSNNYHQFTTGRSGQTDGSYGFRVGITDNGSASEAELRLRDNAAMRFYTNATERLTIAAGGNIGAGIATPQNLVHINNANANSSVFYQVTTSIRSKFC